VYGRSRRPAPGPYARPTASDIARPQSVDQQNPQDQVSLSDSMVALMQARNDYEANLKSLETNNNMAKKLIDMLA